MLAFALVVGLHNLQFASAAADVTPCGGEFDGRTYDFSPMTLGDGQNYHYTVTGEGAGNGNLTLEWDFCVPIDRAASKAKCSNGDNARVMSLVDDVPGSMTLCQELAYVDSPLDLRGLPPSNATQGQSGLTLKWTNVEKVCEGDTKFSFSVNLICDPAADSVAHWQPVDGGLVGACDYFVTVRSAQGCGSPSAKNDDGTNPISTSSIILVALGGAVVGGLFMGLIFYFYFRRTMLKKDQLLILEIED